MNSKLEGSSTDLAKPDIVYDLSPLSAMFFFFFKLFLFVFPAFGGDVILYCNSVLF